jgi:carnitine O-palmitoyltransferase 1
MSPKLYQLQPCLPKLPVPELDHTLKLYLKSVQPLVTPEEFKETSRKVKEFRKKEGPQLQKALQARAATTDNWLVQWWEELVYLSGRTPLPVFSNWYGLDRVDPFQRSQVARAANLTSRLVAFRELVRTEKLEPNRVNDTVPLCMAQYARIFGTTRVPKRGMDELVTYDSEHIVVVCLEQFFRVSVYDPKSGKPLAARDLQVHFSRVLSMAESRDPAKEPKVAALTSLPRDEWADLRAEIIDMDRTNAATIEAIETALFIMVLDETEPKELEDLAGSAIVRHSRAMWFDKNFSMIIFKNARMCSNVDHTWADAGVMVHVFDYAFSTESSVDHWVKFQPTDADLKRLGAPERLEWNVTAEVDAACAQALVGLDKLDNTLDLHVLKFQHFGKGFVKRLGVSPDAFCQMALQLAYFRLFGKSVLTYETGATVRFALGRTETVRSCSNESKAFVDAMVDDSVSDEERAAKLRAACKAHVKYLRLATNGEGCDRHMFGLKVLAAGSGMETPAIFDDVAWKKEFVLSSSQTPALSTLGGGFAPLTADGIGASYVVAEDRVWFHISTYKDCPTTSSKVVAEALESALIEMRSAVMSSPKLAKSVSKRVQRVVGENENN